MVGFAGLAQLGICSAAIEDGVILVGGAGIPISRDREIWKFPSPLLPLLPSPPLGLLASGEKGEAVGDATLPFLFWSFCGRFAFAFLPFLLILFVGQGFLHGPFSAAAALSRRSRPCSTDASGVDPERGGSRVRHSIKTAPAPAPAHFWQTAEYPYVKSAVLVSWPGRGWTEALFKTGGGRG